MKEFVITERGFFVGGVEQEVGSRYQAEELPVTLIGKAEEVVSELTLEVATPRRGRPPKE